MKAQCLQCLNEFESVKGAKYCCTNCRIKYHRRDTIEDDTITDNDTIETPDVTPKKNVEEDFGTENGVKLTYDHVCIECKKPVHPLITICLPCFTEKRKKQLEGNKVVVEKIEEKKEE